MPTAVKLAFPKPKKRNKRKTFWRNGHEYLYGMEAHFERRKEIYRRAGGIVHGILDQWLYDSQAALCEGCLLRGEFHRVSWSDGEWHHNVKSYGGRRCDCAACGLWVCKEWHVKHHGRIIGGRSAA